MSKFKLKKTTLNHTPFEGLGDALVRRQAEGRNKRVNPDEELFHEAMSDVTEIKEFRELPVDEPPAPCQRKTPREEDALQVLNDIVEGRCAIRLSDTSEYMEGDIAGVSAEIIRRLHEGELSVQDSLDMHGMSREQAEAAFGEFINGARRRDLRCVKIIHGRGLRSPGEPVLKRAVRSWLEGRFRRWTAAYCTARACDGGLGATYVLLRRRR